MFVRLQGCRVGCRWCDTKFSWPINKGGSLMTPRDIVAEICRVSGVVNKVTITGGEPMEQYGEAFVELLDLLGEYDISMETAGTEDLEPLMRSFPRINLIVDYKLASAHAQKPPHVGSLRYLRPRDVVKFVATIDEVIEVHRIALQLRALRCAARLVLSPVWGTEASMYVGLDEIVAKMKMHDLPALGVGLNLQLHKFIWPNARDEEIETA